MKNSLSILPRCSLLCALLLFVQNVSAWDSTGHRISAAVAMIYLSESTRAHLYELLQQHPRYQQDFIGQMPASVARGNEAQRLNWLLGQAAFWPDIIRGLPDNERQKYNHANWHYIDGAWVRGQAITQGNSYIGVPRFDDIVGIQASRVRHVSQVNNIMTALDYNTAILADHQNPAAERALALCWVLHLVADIHLPLHVGSLYSANVFQEGDRGGNGIVTKGGNLHARWDRALHSEGIIPGLQAILEQHAGQLAALSADQASDWSLWMNESRQLLLESVYTAQMKTSIAAADQSSKKLPKFTLSDAYLAQMQESARQRLALAGRRLAIWFENNIAPPPTPPSNNYF